jgi:hypothetical protein
MWETISMLSRTWDVSVVKVVVKGAVRVVLAAVKVVVLVALVVLADVEGVALDRLLEIQRNFYQLLFIL